MAANSKSSQYTAKTPDSEGNVDYSVIENDTWSYLYQRQMQVVETRACTAYLDGLDQLQLSQDRVPQIPEVNRVLRQTTGWELTPVEAVIPFGTFFELLSQRQFPAATFIRRWEDIDYLQEPDIFHEIYGHCPLLTDPVFADFVQAYGKLGLQADKQERVYLARLFWFTVEFGLIQTPVGLRVYGAGILSSKGETQYALEDARPQRRPFNVMDILRTPYRIDIYQPVYYVIDDFSQLYQAMDASIMPLIHAAIEQGMFLPTYTGQTATVSNRHLC